MSLARAASFVWASWFAGATMAGAFPVAAQSDPAREAGSPHRTVMVAVEFTAHVHEQVRIDRVGGRFDGPVMGSGGLGIWVDRRFGLVTIGGGLVAHVGAYGRLGIESAGPLDLYDVPARLGVRDSIRTRFGALELGVVGIVGPSVSTRRWADALTRGAPRPSGPDKRANVGAVVGGFGVLALRRESFVWSLEAGYQHHLVASFDVIAPGGVDPTSYGNVLDVRVALGGPCVRIGFGFAR